MKCLLVLAAVLTVAFAQMYTDKYDNMDVEETLSNEKLRTNYFNCVMDKGPCTAEGKELKDHLQDAIETGCSKCTNKQKDTSAKIIKKLIEEYIEIWNELTAKYDPTGKWRNEYRERAKTEYGIDVPAK